MSVARAERLIKRYARNACCARSQHAHTTLVARRPTHRLSFVLKAGGRAVGASIEPSPAMLPAARAPPNVLVVVCPAGASPEHPVVIPANDPVVTRTGFLDWADAPAVGVGAGSARKQLTTSQALRAFGRRLRFTQVAAHRPAVMPGVLEVAFTGAAWSKYLGELLASGLLWPTSTACTPSKRQPTVSRSSRWPT